MKLYPAIDLLGGECVRLRQGGFDQATVYSADPLATARAFESAGAEYLHVVDLSGAKNPADRQTALIAKLIRATKLKIQVGGGLRVLEDAAGVLGEGADRVVFGSAAVSDPKLALRILREIGPSRFTLALDVRFDDQGTPRVALHGWKEQSAHAVTELFEELAPHGLERVLCTDISRDGMMNGPNTALYADLMARFPSVEVQASGGVSSLADLLALKAAGVRSAVIGKALYEGAVDLREALLQC